MAMPTIIAFSWGADRFHKAAARLIEDCERFGYRHRIRVGADLDEHFAACPGEPWEKRRWIYRYIPGLILEELDREESEDGVLYLHADYRINDRIPERAFRGLDVGLQKRWAWRPETSSLPGLAAPIYARNNDQARRFLRYWRAQCLEVDDGGGEHGPLMYAWSLFRNKDRSVYADWFHVNIASQAADADCAIVGHKREEDYE